MKSAHPHIVLVLRSTHWTKLLSSTEHTNISYYDQQSRVLFLVPSVYVSVGVYVYVCPHKNLKTADQELIQLAKNMCCSEPHKCLQFVYL